MGYQQRYLRSDQIVALSQAVDKPLSEQMLWRRLRLLRKHGYLGKLPKRHQAKAVYCLADRGAELMGVDQAVPVKQLSYLADSGEASEYFLAHTLAIADFRCALTLALLEQQKDAKLEWTAEAELRRQKVQVQVPGCTKPLPLRPDGFARFQNPAGTRLQCFVEIDMGTEQLAVFARKVQAYLRYEQSDVQFKQVQHQRPFVVLTVTTSEARLLNLIETTESAGGGTRFRFTVFEHLTPEHVLGDIWKEAGSMPSRFLERRFGLVVS